VNYLNWQNMQWTLSPRPNNSFDDTLNDLTSFQFLNTTKVWALYGIDSRMVIDNTTLRDSYDYKPSGAFAFAFNSWEVIAWGYDCEGVPYAVVYETPAFQTPAAFDIISRSDKGPTKNTIDMIHRAVADLRNNELSGMLAQVKKLVQNGGRNGSKCS